jgi:hypothetical protein
MTTGPSQVAIPTMFSVSHDDVFTIASTLR